MIAIIDSFRFGEEHAPFNAAFIDIVNKCFPDEKTEIYIQKEHWKIIYDILNQNSGPDSDRTFEILKGIDSKNGTLSLFLSYLICTFQDTKVLFKSNSKLFFYTTANPLALFFIKLVNLLLRKRVYVVLHGELEYLNKGNDKSLKLQTRLLRQWYRLIFWKFLTRNFSYILLGESIRSNLKSLKPSNFPNSNFITIDHPYFFKTGLQKSESFVPLNLGIVGHSAEVKGSHKIFELAELNDSEISNGKMKFKIIGHISNCILKYQNKLVETPSRNDFLPRTEYEKEISSLHYILFFYPNSMYQYIASGAFFDAISFEKPIIALRNSFFEHYFNRYGEIGYLCDSLEEMSYYLSNINLERYNLQLQNIKQAKKDLSLENISQRLRSQLI
ncbi:hypothetical protein [Mangrovibacterium sp.]|uniref:hypothetical protein n=1 Tax=Mangrovibacterium sp. TaxID=1961364 RepID=UPI003565DFEC